MNLDKRKTGKIFSFLAIALGILVLSGCVNSNKKGIGKFRTVVVDAGHGGTDRGACNNGGVEAKINFEVANRTASILKRKYGFNIVRTRRSDTFVSLPDRSKIANRTRNAIFVSIHSNSAPNRSAYGVEVFYRDARTQRLAATISNNITRSYPTQNRGVKRANFFVLRETRIPALLCEIGFLSNPRECQYLLRPQVKQRIAQGIASAIASEAARSGKKKK